MQHQRTKNLKNYENLANQRKSKMSVEWDGYNSIIIHYVTFNKLSLNK